MERYTIRTYTCAHNVLEMLYGCKHGKSENAAQMVASVYRLNTSINVKSPQLCQIYVYVYIHTKENIDTYIRYIY